MTVLTRAFHGQPRRERSDGVQIRRTSLAGRSAPASFMFVGESLLRLLPRAARGGTILHAHGAMSEGTIALGATALGIPAVVTVFGTGWMGDFERLATKPGGRARERWLMRRAWFVALSAEIRSELEQLGAPPDRIFDIPNGVDQLVYHPAQPDERDRLRVELGLPARPPRALRRPARAHQGCRPPRARARGRRRADTGGRRRRVGAPGARETRRGTSASTGASDSSAPVTAFRTTCARPTPSFSRRVAKGCRTRCSRRWPPAWPASPPRRLAFGSSSPTTAASSSAATNRPPGRPPSSASLPTRRAAREARRKGVRARA